jgi:thiol-disulfide isomerase/thioredoxin
MKHTNILLTYIALMLLTALVPIKGVDTFTSVTELKSSFSDEMVPEFEFNLLDTGETLTNNSMKGSYYMVYFWGTSCVNCNREMPYLHEAYKTLKDDNFKIIAVSYDDSEDVVRKFREQRFPMPWMHYVMGPADTYERYNQFEETMTSFGFSGSPYKIIVSPEGKILDRIKGFSGDQLQKKITQNLYSEK